jgi:HEAT repeat protein
MVDERIPLSKTLIDLRIKELELEEKARVISELKARQDEASIRELAEKLADDSWHLRELAVRGLSEIGRAVEHPVMDILPGSLWFTRACAAQVLGNVRSRAGIAALIGLLDDCNATVKDCARKAIVQICSAGDTVWVARVAVSAGPDAIASIHGVLEKSRRELADSFFSMSRDSELMKAPPDKVEKMAEEMYKKSESPDLVWEELTSKDNQKAGPAGGIADAGGSEGTANTNKEEGGGEAGEHGGL